MIQIAIMGLGTVGTGVAKVIEANEAPIRRKLGDALAVKRILVRHFKNGPYRHLMTDELGDILTDGDIRVVVETIGGVGAAYDYTKQVLAAGKHVVTANKQLVAERGCELLALAREHGVHYLFEASVGGGIPILHPLTQCLAANRVDEVYGILNGTTNYILTKMLRQGASFADALAEAQAKGYAEADPTADVEGIDAGRKTCILADLAFGRQVDPAAVPMEGISHLDLRDVKIAEKAGCRVKLLGRTLRLQEGGVTAYVAPHLIPDDAPIANVDDVFNAVLVRGNATGEVMFYGKGAGELPTASACVSDVMEALQTGGPRRETAWSAEPADFIDPETVCGRWYVRAAATAEQAAAAFGRVEVLAEEGGETAFLTGSLSGREAGERAAALGGVRARIRVLA